jgi:hypothetical protein
MSNLELSGKDIILMLLYCPGIDKENNEPIVGRTKLTKMMFLFEKEVCGDLLKGIKVTLPVFEPYHFGPFSKGLFEDLSFLLSIGLICTEDTLIPISNAAKYEYKMSNDDEWSEATFDETDEENVELKYLLSKQGIKYVEENVWNQLSSHQQSEMIQFKRQINSISLDTLLNYVYNKYPESAQKSVIADKYLDSSEV